MDSSDVVAMLMGCSIVGTAFKVLVYDLIAPTLALRDGYGNWGRLAWRSLHGTGSRPAGPASTARPPVYGGGIRATLILGLHREHLRRCLQSTRPAGVRQPGQIAVGRWPWQAGLQSMAHKNWVHSVAFLPDGGDVAGGGDATIRGGMWQMQETRQASPTRSQWTPSCSVRRSRSWPRPANTHLQGARAPRTASLSRMRGNRRWAGCGVFSLAMSPDGTLLHRGRHRRRSVRDIAAGSPTYGTSLAVLEAHPTGPTACSSRPTGPP